jgi:protein phosphatase
MSHYRFCGLTHQGRVRKLNEDAWMGREDIALWAVADGLGGHSAGDYASQQTVAYLSQMQRPSEVSAFLDALEDGLSAVNQHLLDYAADKGVEVVGSTIVLAVGAGPYLVTGWAGDSRLYLMTESKFGMVSTDHTHAQSLMDTGSFSIEEIMARPDSAAITRAVGGDQTLYIEWRLARSAPGYRFLLCSDGLTKEVEDSEIHDYLREHREPEAAAQALLELALSRGGRDNITIVVIDRL